MLVVVATRASETRELAALAERAAPLWLLVAAVLQSLTYVAQAGVWKIVLHRARTGPSLRELTVLSVAKLFVDQAIPSAGISGTLVIVKALERRGVARGPIMACVVVETITNFTALGLALLVALAWASLLGASALLVWGVGGSFIGLCVVASLVVHRLSRGSSARLPAFVRRIPGLREVLQALAEAPPGLAHRPRILVEGTLLNGAIHLLDAATLWSLLRSVGVDASPAGTFASFMLSTLARTVGVVPGGLGTFEAAAVGTLNLAGVPVAAALAAALLFRGVSFWAPLVPGLLFARAELKVQRRLGGGPAVERFWALPEDELLRRLGVGPTGLASEEARRRLAEHGPNSLDEPRGRGRLALLWAQLRSPLVLLLVGAAAVAAAAGEWADATIVVAIVLASVLLGYTREARAETALARLRERVAITVRVLRDGKEAAVPLPEVVPGELVRLSAGSVVPADARLLDATDLFVTEAALTGESFPVEKRPGTVPEEAPLTARDNCVFRGAHVRSGTATCLVVATGAATRYGELTRRLALRPPESEFDRGLRHFGWVLLTTMLVMVLFVLGANVLLERPPIETLLFSLALAVGLSPELLPAILSVNLAAGAQALAGGGVLVRRLGAIEDLGSMDVLCTDKTGTLTEGVVRLAAALDPGGEPSEQVLRLAAENASLQAGLRNPLDEAILRVRQADPGAEKLGEVPWDFVRKRLSVVVRDGEGARLVVKGAFGHVLSACTTLAAGALLDGSSRRELSERFEAWSRQGIRVLAVATRPVEARARYGRDDEEGLSFAGFLTFVDRPKEGVAAAIAELSRLGITVKVITGDGRLVAEHLAGEIGLAAGRVITGSQLDEMRDEALWRRAEQTDLFVEVDPNQKERIILALKKTGHVVGFLGDGINDAPAMHAADTSVSVEGAADVAREAADFVLLRRDLHVLRQGVEQGRRTFANSLKYVLTTTSANLGNMISMAVASLFLPFLPLLAGQILLNNFLSDIPAVGLAGDHVDPEQVERPRRWDMGQIVRFMVLFGLLSSLFDLFTFGVLLRWFHAGPELFRTGWFVESLLTELAVALVVRTRRPFLQSRPGTVLWVSTAVVAALTVLLPFLPVAVPLGFVAPPGTLLGAMVAITCVYVAVTDLVKRAFFRRERVAAAELKG